MTSWKRSKNGEDCLTNIQKSPEKETNQSLLHNKSGNGFINNLKASNTIVQDGHSTLPPGRRIRLHLRHHIGNSSDGNSNRSRASWRRSWTEQFFFSSFFRDVISLAGIIISWQSTGVDRHTFRAPHFLMHRVVFLVVRLYSRTLIYTHLHGSFSSASLCLTSKHFILGAPCHTRCRI